MRLKKSTKRSLLRFGWVALLALLPGREALAQPRAFFQVATPQGLDNRMNLSRVPVRAANGSIKYFDVALSFAVDAAGRLTIHNAATRITPSPELVVGAFRPGIYRNESDEYVVGAPGVAGSRVAGSIGTFDFGPLLNIGWVSGPIVGHPNEALLRSAGITFEGYSWGTVGAVGSTWSNFGFEPGHIVGVVQTGQSLTIHNFGDDNRVDTSAVFIFCSSCS